jgi:streptomycin 6-kinase
VKLPSDFIATIQSVYREGGHAFLRALPDLIAEASKRWGVTDVRPVPMLSYNFVAFAKRAQREVVLKMGVPNPEMKSEIAALQLFNGEGACKLLEYDEEKCWMLLERLTPGEMLITLKDDEEATRIAAEVMKKIWRSMESSGLPLEEQDPAPQKFILLSEWFNGLKRLRAAYNGGTGPLNSKLVERVEASVQGFFVENHQPVLMHGDFHHYNILSSERGWLIIDPKGVIGPAGYEVGPLLLNPWGELINRSDVQKITKRRIDILHEHLGFERERIHAWGLAHAVLSSWWSIEDNTGWEYAAAFAEMIAELEM